MTNQRNYEIGFYGATSKRPDLLRLHLRHTVEPCLSDDVRTKLWFIVSATGDNIFIAMARYGRVTQ